MWGSGRKLIKLISAEAEKTTPKEHTLAFTEWQAFAMKPFVGELNLLTFEDNYERYELLRNCVGESMRGTDVTVVQYISTIMYRTGSGL